MNNHHLYESSNTRMVVDQNARHQSSQKVKIFRYFRYFIYLPNDYDNYKKMPKEKNVGRDGEEA